MADINNLSQLVNGIVQNIDLAANTLVVSSIKVGAGQTELTQAVLDNLVSLQNGTDIASSLHSHDSQYFTETELGSVANGAAGAGLIGVDQTPAFTNITGATVQAALESIDTALSTAGVSVFDDAAFRIEDAAGDSLGIAFDVSAVTAVDKIITMPDTNINLGDIATNAQNLTLHEDGGASKHDATEIDYEKLNVAVKATLVKDNITYNEVNFGDEQISIIYVSDVLLGSEFATISGNDVTIHYANGASQTAALVNAMNAVPAIVSLLTITAGAALTQGTPGTFLLSTSSSGRKNIGSTSNDAEKALSNLDNAIGAMVQGTNYTAADATIAADHLAGLDTAVGTASSDAAQVASDLSNHISDAVGAHAATAISNIPAGDIAAITVQAAIDELDSEKLALAGGTMSGAIAMGTSAITGMADPSSAQDAATKSYVDAVAQGLKPKEAVRVASTAPGVFATDFDAGSTLDGIALIAGDRILIKDQAAAAENGIYIVQASPSAPVRATDMDSLSPIDEVNGAYVPVQEGTLNTGKFFVQQGTVATIDTDAINFVFFNSVALLSGGNGIDITANVITTDIDTNAGLEINGAKIRAKTDESSIERNITNGLQVKALGIQTSMMAATSVTAAKLGSDVSGTGLTGGNGVAIDINFSTTFAEADRAVAAAKLASVANGEGASIIGIEDAAGNFSPAADVEAALAEAMDAAQAAQAQITLHEDGTASKHDATEVDYEHPATATAAGIIDKTNFTANPANYPGTAGNAISVEILSGGVTGAPVVTVTAQKISIVADTSGGDGNSSIITALGAAGTAVSDLVSFTDAGGFIAATAESFLSGGVNGSINIAPATLDVQGALEDLDQAVGALGTPTLLAGAGLVVNGSALDVNVDNVTLEINADIVRVKDLGISTAKIADDAVTLPKMFLAFSGSIIAPTANTGFEIERSAAGPMVQVARVLDATAFGLSADHATFGSNVIGSSSGVVTELIRADANTANTGEVQISSGGHFGLAVGGSTPSTGNSGRLDISSGQVEAGISGQALMQSGAAVSAGGVSGQAIVRSGAVNAGTGVSGNATFASGTTIDGASGTIVMQSGDVSGTGNSGITTINSGSTINGASGELLAFSGDISGTGNSGHATLASGSTISGLSGNIFIGSGGTSSGTSGTAVLKTGNAVTGTTNAASVKSGKTTAGTGNTGTVELISGNSFGGNSGPILLKTGTAASGTRGVIRLETATDLSVLLNTPSIGGTGQAIVDKDWVIDHISVAEVTQISTNQTDISNLEAAIGSLEWQDSVKSFVDNTALPPTEVTGDRYLLDATGASNAAWDGAAANSVVEFDGTLWVATAPTTGMFVSADDASALLYYYGGASWSTKDFEATTASTGLTKVGFDIRLDAAAAGAGIAFAAGVMSINATSGLSISGDDVILDSSAAGAGIAYAAGVLSLDAASAGDGLALAAGIYSVNVGDGLQILTDTVEMDLKVGGGLKIDATKLAIEPADFAGSGLEDDGADNLRVTGQFIQLTNNTGAALAVGDVVALSLTVSGEMIVADASGIATAESIVGVVAEAIADTATGSVQITGRATVAQSATFTLGKRVYLSEVAGEGTSTPPTTPLSAVYLLGGAISTTEVLLMPALVAVNQ